MPVLELPVVAKNETPDTCRACGGDCCKSMPGSYHPAQFGPDLAGVYELLRDGRASIDRWEGSEVKLRREDGKTEYVPIPNQGYYLRPAIKTGRRKGVPLFAFMATPDGDGGVFDLSYGGECVHLGAAGCGLKFEDRPLNCQALVANPARNPDRDVYCRTPEEFNKPGLVIAWNPYAPKLEEIGRRAEDERYRRA